MLGMKVAMIVVIASSLIAGNTLERGKRV